MGAYAKTDPCTTLHDVQRLAVDSRHSLRQPRDVKPSLIDKPFLSQPYTTLPFFFAFFFSPSPSQLCFKQTVLKPCKPQPQPFHQRRAYALPSTSIPLSSPRIPPPLSHLQPAPLLDLPQLLSPPLKHGLLLPTGGSPPQIPPQILDPPFPPPPRPLIPHPPFVSQHPPR